MVEENRRRCVLCGERYKHCKCVCSWCGTKKWSFNGRKWVHHVCARKQPAAVKNAVVAESGKAV